MLISREENDVEAKYLDGIGGEALYYQYHTQTIEEAKELYQKFKEQLPLEDDSDEDERTEVIYISPDCKWVITEKWSEFQLVNTMTLFFQKEKEKEKTGRK